MVTDTLFIYCDGGCRNNQSKNNIGGWGVYLVYGHHTKEMYGSTKNTSNQKMELLACINGLKSIKNKGLPVVVISDSQYLVKGITEWINGWTRRDWRNAQDEPVGNKELWQELLSLKNTFSNISFRHCKGHGNTQGNMKADSLANRAMDEMKQ